MLFREAILWSDRLSVGVTVVARQGGYAFALHIKQCCAENGPTQTSASMGEDFAKRKILLFTLVCRTHSMHEADITQPANLALSVGVMLVMDCTKL